MLFDLETPINFQLFSIGKGGDNMNKNINIRNHVCHCTEDCVTIINSYDVAESDLKPFLNELKSKIGSEFKYKRTINDWAQEWYAHNVLYKLGLFRSHTRSVDLNEDETKCRVLMYKLIYKFRPKKK